MAHLALFFGEHLSLAFLPPVEVASFCAAGVMYRDLEAGHFVAHYDRLVGPSGKLAGIQIWAIPEDAGLGRLLDRLPPREYLETVARSPTIYGVHLSGFVKADLTSTGDQAFGGQIFRGENGELALSIDLDYLCAGRGEAAEASEAADLTALRGANASWVQLSELMEHPPRQA